MRILQAGHHDFAVPPIYDWGSESVSSTKVFVGRASLPEPSLGYQVDFSYLGDHEVCDGATVLGQFEGTAEAFQALGDALGAIGVPADAVLERNVLYCNGAAFHEDGAFNTIFATALWHGQEGDVVFPRLGVRVELTPGDFVVFDCHEPHGFVGRGKSTWHPSEYAGGRLSHMLTFDLDRLNPSVRHLFGLREASRPPAGCVRDKGARVCPSTGAYLAPR